MSALAVTAGPTLDELAAEIRSEHQQCVLAAVSSLSHAIRAGEALLAAREQVPRGQWEPWLDGNCPDAARMARQYMRIASYKEMLPPEASTAVQAERALRGLPAFDGSGPRRHPPEVRERAFELSREGVSQNMIAKMLGIDRKCVRRWLVKEGRPQPREGHYRTGRPTRREQKEREALVRRERARHAIGPAALASYFRTVVEIQHSGTSDELAAALLDLSRSAADWAKQVKSA